MCISGSGPAEVPREVHARALDKQPYLRSAKEVPCRHKSGLNASPKIEA